MYHDLKKDKSKAELVKMPGEAYFIKDHNILAIPRDDGDCRYPYGKDGFNYWTYASGYIHCNEGLFSPFLRANEGSEPKIAFFAGFDTEPEMFSLLSVPVIGNDKGLIRYTIFTKSATYYITEKNNVIFGIRTFVDNQRRIYFTIEIVNKNYEPLRIKLSSFFNPFVKNSLMENSTDRWFRKATYYDTTSLGSFQVEAYEEKDRSSMTTNYGILNRSIDNEGVLKAVDVTTSRYDFVGGIRSSLHSARVIKEGKMNGNKTVTSFTETAICADLITLEVKDSVRIDIKFSFVFEEEAAENLREEILESAEIDALYEAVVKADNIDGKGIEFITKEANNNAKDLGLKEEVFNGFMEHLKKQVEFCSVIKGYIQLSSFSLIGIRDVFQALEGLMYWQPEIAKAKMLEGLNFLSPEGRLPRQYSLPADKDHRPAMDLRPFIDQGVWVISTIAAYLKQTKDYDFLKETCGYYDIVDENKHMVKKNPLQDSVLEHLFKIMSYLLENRDHDHTKCVLALYGDWNDALDGLGKSNDPSKEYGTGVSVMVTLQVYQNLQEMIDILSNVYEHAYKETVDRYKVAKKEIRSALYTYALKEDRILHGWGDKMSYFVGSQKDPDGKSRVGLTSNAFWILSNMYRDSILENNEMEDRRPEEIKSIILEAYRQLDSKYGMKTFEPYFEKGTPGVGRIPNLPPGTAENGATYIHASMFGVMSLFEIGESKLAWEELGKLLPITHETVSISPYVAPNSYGFNEALGIDGESMQDWQTGSSNVLLKTVIRFVYGYEPTFDGLIIQPSLYKPFDLSTFKVNYLGKTVHIKISKANVNKRTFLVNGKIVSGSYDPVMKMDRLILTDSFISELGKDTILFIEVQDV